MASIPEDLRYTKDHEWARKEGNVLTIGVTDHAQEQLGDVVYVELPEAGDEVNAGEPFGNIESTKAMSELFAPVTGKVVDVNDALVDSPEVVNEDAYGDGWLVQIELTDEDEWNDLMDAEAYAAHIEEEQG